MTYLQKQKIKSRLIIFAFGVFGLFIAWASDANAFSSHFTDPAEGGCAAAGCHDTVAVTNTCDGCHAHGTHSSTATGGIAIVATSDKTAYVLGETITVSLATGNASKGNWIRATLYDSSSNVLDQSSGTCDATTSTGMPPSCSNGETFNQIGLTVSADTLGTGTHNLTASWYGHDFDRAGGNFGTTTTSVTQAGYMADVGNTNHGEEIVAVNQITITDPNAGSSPAPAAAPSSGGGGSVSWYIVALFLIAVIATLIRDRKLIPVKIKREK